jgi:hypothetical protein
VVHLIFADCDQRAAARLITGVIVQTDFAKG